MRLKRNSICLWAMGYGVWAIIAGCGYTTRAILPEGVGTIHPAVFENNIGITKEVSSKDKYEVYRPNLEVDLRDAIVERIFLDGHLKVSSMEYADAILEGQIIEYRKDPLRYQNEDVTEYRISLVCDVVLKSAKGSKVFLEEKSITGDTTYFTSGSLQKSETDALKDAMSDLARRVVHRIVENW